MYIQHISWVRYNTWIVPYKNSGNIQWKQVTGLYMFVYKVLCNRLYRETCTNTDTRTGKPV